ncbi:hypothetical protein [Pseudoalteromonas piratica]|uniref:Uncharacterized protein n=1 Tax=Pseudoalteromonas piratica TaxID=1348114 RepID=A0A0A7EIJ2_9GAMM|nr:hypothetical protein [Pseudoalteromonas piratica]AIY65787.1 hypothetical protein OM33_12010 [Pseudoalteromonas piratica]
MQDIVIAAISKLLAAKKQPNVALVKANLSQPVPMPVIIDVLARFKQNPSDFEKNAAEQTTKPTVQTAHSQSQLDRIEAKLDKLLSLLENK